MLGFQCNITTLKIYEINKPNAKRTRRFLIGDSIEGWADAVTALIKSYFTGTSKLRFDFSDIRPKGATLVTSGGKAPGPQPLRECLVKIDGLLSQKDDGDQLSSLEVHDIVCHVADAVLAGALDVPPLSLSSLWKMKRCLQRKPATGGRQIPKEEEQTTLL